MTDQPVPPAADRAFDAVAEAKVLLRAIRAGALATLDQNRAPFASLVATATLPDGSPILLLSKLASHTGHLEAEARCSLLLARGGRGDPLAHPRLTITGCAERLDGEARTTARRRFLARNPKSELYVDFPDFAFWRIAVAEAHLNGGFGRAAKLGGRDVLTEIADAAALLAAEPGAVEHMNDDHADALSLYAEVLAGRDKGPWRASGIDPDGLDLICGDRTARIPFETRVTTPEELRGVLVALAKGARAFNQTRS